MANLEYPKKKKKKKKKKILQPVDSPIKLVHSKTHIKKKISRKLSEHQWGYSQIDGFHGKNPIGTPILGNPHIYLEKKQVRYQPTIPDRTDSRGGSRITWSLEHGPFEFVARYL